MFVFTINDIIELFFFGTIILLIGVILVHELWIWIRRGKKK